MSTVSGSLNSLAAATTHDIYLPLSGRKADEAGRLAGQWMPYLANAVTDFNGGHREMPKKMRAKMQELKDRDFEELVHFYGSQK